MSCCLLKIKKQYENTLFYKNSFHAEALNDLGESHGRVALNIIYENLVNLFFQDI